MRVFKRPWSGSGLERVLYSLVSLFSFVCTSLHAKHGSNGLHNFSPIISNPPYPHSEIYALVPTVEKKTTAR